MDCTKNCKFERRTREHLVHHIKNNIPTKIDYRELDLLPTRQDFINVEHSYLFDQLIQNGRSILFMPNDVHDNHESTNAYVNYEDRGGNRGEFTYQPQIFGILPDGRKICVILTDIPIYVDVRVVGSVEDTWKRISDKTSMHYKCRDNIHKKTCLEYKSYETVNLRPLHGFSRYPIPYIRIYFGTLFQRNKMITMIRDHLKLNTASDDASDNYFMKMARDFRFNTGAWNRIVKYTNVSSHVKNGCAYTFLVNIKDYVRLKKSDRAKYPTFLLELLDKDLTNMCTWDIETYRTIQNGIVPTPVDTDYTIFMICAYFGHHWSMTGFLDVCFVAAEIDVRENMRVIVTCENQNQVIDGFERVLSNMRPEFIATFNGSSFDWPLVLEIMRRTPGRLVEFKRNVGCMRVQNTGAYADTDASVLDKDFRHETFKINAENKIRLDRVCKLPGMIDIDVSPIFRKMYATNEIQLSKSLNFYLTENKLDGKEDMPYTRLFRIYERSLELLTAPRQCHCDAHCSVCTHHLNEVDRIAEVDKDNVILQYTDQFIPALMRDGELLCCHCGKRPQNLRDMADAGYYCVVDCMRPHQLLVKRAIISEKRQLANMAHVKLFNAFMRADGEKVRNLIGAGCYRRGIAFTNAKVQKGDHEKDHYPGAHVFQPNCGLNNTRPITAVDFSSLYPSEKRAYNFSPDMIVKDPKMAEELIRDGYILEPIGPFEYERGIKKGEAQNTRLVGQGWSVRHGGIIDPARDQKIITGYKKRYAITVDGKKTIFDEAEANKICDDYKSRNIKYARAAVYEPIYGRDALPGERMGVTAVVVDKLFNKRVPVKQLYVKLSTIIEEASKAGKHTAEVEIDGKIMTMTIDDIAFQASVVEAKQKAIKVLSNTFYGECGNFRSPVYELLVAAGITTHGQQSIKAVASYVINKGFRVQYGDTDSLYVISPDEYYRAIDAKYKACLQSIQDEYNALSAAEQEASDARIAAEVKAQIASEMVKYERNPVMLNLTKFKHDEIFNGTPALTKRVLEFRAKIKYWEEMVIMTMQIINNLTVEIADYLMYDNGTRYLTMAYEEVGFPTVLCGKKKYFLKPHIKTVDFESEAIMIRGIEVVKQGQAPVARRIGKELIFEALSPYNSYSLLELSERKLTKFYRTDWDPTEFAKASTYRPHKKNVSVNTFVDRMRHLQGIYSAKTDEDNRMRALYDPPAPGDKFKWIYVKKPQEYTMRGCIVKAKKGDKMEYLRVYYASKQTSLPLEIDLEEYVNGGIKGLMARFIVYHADFQPNIGQFDTSTDAGYKSFDAFRVDAATDYLTEFIQKITGTSRQHIRDDGAIYRKQYKTIDKAFREAINTKYGIYGDIVNYFNIDDEANVARSTMIVEQVIEVAERQIYDIEPVFADLMKQFGSVFVLRRIYCSTGAVTGICKLRIERINIQINSDVAKLRKYGMQFGEIIARQQRNIIALVQDMRSTREINAGAPINAIDFITNLTDAEQTILREVDILRHNIIALYRSLIYNKKLMDKIEIIRNQQSGTVNILRYAREDATAIPAPPEYKFT